MKQIAIVRIPAKLSSLGVDEIYYEVTTDDWHARAERLQERRWHLLQHAARALRTHRQ